MLPEKGYKRVIVISFYVFLALVISYLFFKYLFSCTLPFAIAFIGAYFSKGAVRFLNQKLKFKRLFASLVVTFGILAATVSLLYFLISSIISELSTLTEYLSEDSISSLITDVSESLVSFGYKYFPDTTDRLFPEINRITDNLGSLITGIAKAAIPVIGKFVVSVLSLIPDVFLFTAVTILAMLYFSCDYERITAFIKLQLDSKKLAFARELKNQFFSTVLNVIRAYSVLIFITFSELLVGFMLLKIEYATILALFTAIVDILPVLGTGTVLIPWALILFITGNAKMGLSILLLYVIITVVRQIAEPKILGDAVGLHPLVTLMSMYFGVKLAGLKGLFFIPIIVIIIKNLNESNCIHLYKNAEYNGKPSKQDNSNSNKTINIRRNKNDNKQN